MLIYYQQRRKTKDTMFLSKILIHSRIAIFYIMEKNIFIVIVYRISVQKKHSNVLLKEISEIDGKQRIIIPKKGKYLKFKSYGRK